MKSKFGLIVLILAGWFFLGGLATNLVVKTRAHEERLTHDDLPTLLHDIEFYHYGYDKGQGLHLLFLERQLKEIQRGIPFIISDFLGNSPVIFIPPLTWILFLLLGLRKTEISISRFPQFSGGLVIIFSVIAGTFFAPVPGIFLLIWALAGKSFSPNHPGRFHLAALSAVLIFLSLFLLPIIHAGIIFDLPLLSITGILVVFLGLLGLMDLHTQAITNSVQERKFTLKTLRSLLPAGIFLILAVADFIRFFRV